MAQSQLRFVEFFEGNGRRLSMSRLLVFLAFWPSAWVMLKNPSEAMVGLFLGAFVVNYLGGKSADIFMDVEKLEASGNSNTGGDAGVTGSGVAQSSAGAAKAKTRAF
jgi:hypothetical protein